MTVEAIMAIITPILSAIAGIAMAVVVFITRIRNVVNLTKESIHDNNEIKKQLDEANHAIVELGQKIGFVVEEAKTRVRDEKTKQE